MSFSGFCFFLSGWITNPPELAYKYMRHSVMVCQNSTLPTRRDIFLYLSVRNILIYNDCLADKYKNMSLLGAV